MQVLAMLWLPSKQCCRCRRCHRRRQNDGDMLRQAHQVGELLDEGAVLLGCRLRLAVAVRVKGVHRDAARRERAKVCKCHEK